MRLPFAKRVFVDKMWAFHSEVARFSCVSFGPLVRSLYEFESFDPHAPALVILLAISIVLPTTGVLAASAVYSALTSDLPDPTQIKKVERDFQTTKIFDRKGGLLYEIIDPTGADR